MDLDGYRIMEVLVEMMASAERSRVPDFLEEVRKDLERRKRIRILRPLVDESNRYYGFFARPRDSLCFYLVARSVPPHRGVLVSSQSWMVREASRIKKAIVMFWGGFYHVFHPRVILKKKNILKKNRGENIRADKRIPIRFLNWEIDLGEEWIGEDLLPIWSTLKERFRLILMEPLKLDRYFGGGRE